MVSLASLIKESQLLEQSGEIATAYQRALQALDLARASGEASALAAALVNLSRVRFHLGHYEAAQELAQDALEIAAPDSPQYVDALLSLGSCKGIGRSLVDAENYFRRAAERARELGHHLLRFRALHNMAAGIYIRRGQFDLALSADEEAYRISRQHELVNWNAYPLITMAWVFLLTRQHQRARATLDELAKLVLKGSALQGYQICLSAYLALDEGDGETARSFCAEGRSIAEATGEPWINVAVRLGMSRFHQLNGHGPEARTWANDALTYATHVGYHQEQGRALIECARAAWLCGDKSAARADLEVAIDIFRDLEATFDLAHGLLLLAALLTELEDAHSPEIWFEAGQTILKHGYPFLLARERFLAFPLIASFLNHPDAAVADMTATLVKYLERLPPEPLHILMLGRFEVWQGKRCIERGRLRQRRAGELLALLLLNPAHSLSVDQVFEALWSEKSLTAAQTALHHATSALRRALESDLPDKFPSRYLEVEEGQATLHLPPGSWVDIEAFRVYCAQNEWEKALSLYGGELLPDYRYAEWTLIPREQSSLLYQRALFATAQLRFARNMFIEVLNACQLLLALEPWHEPAVLLGMRAHVALNDSASARRLYLKLEKTLREDLNTSPQAELQAFYHSLTPSGT